jgi:hypothetical protein
MNYAYNLRVNNHLFHYPQNRSYPHYFYENQVSLQNFVNIPKPAIDYRLKVKSPKRKLIKEINTLGRLFRCLFVS